MEIYLKQSITVPFETLYLDPNNPRLAPENPPGYNDPATLFDSERQRELEKLVADKFDPDKSLEDAIIGQGWMPIDSVVVWTYPEDHSRHIVVEGNRRIVALRRLRQRLDDENGKLAKATSGRSRFAKHNTEELKGLIAALTRIAEDTENLTVVPIDADTIEELEWKLPRVLAVRHITGTKDWSSYAADIWLLERYTQFFEEHFPGDDLRWEASLIRKVAGEASLAPPMAKRKLRAAACFSHFCQEYENRLPDGEEFGESDYYLFENIVRITFLRTQFSLGEDAVHIPEERESVLFQWTFTHPRGGRADDNDNVFYRHENVVVWNKIKNYDDKHGTAFARQLNVDEPDGVTTFRKIEVDYLQHKARRKPTDVIDGLLHQLEQLTVDNIVVEGGFLKAQLERLQHTTQTLLRMIDSAVEV